MKITASFLRFHIEVIADDIGVCYKIKTQQSIAFPYTNNERSEREIRETIPFYIASERIKYLGINLPKGTKDLYFEN